MILSEKNNVESVHHLSHSVTTKEGTNTNIAFHVERYKLSVYGPFYEPLLGMTLVGQTLCLHLGVSVFGCSILVEWGGGGVTAVFRAHLYTVSVNGGITLSRRDLG